MTFTEALKISRTGASPDARPYTVALACGFTPLHVQTFLAGHLQFMLPDRKVTVVPGLFGDLVGTVERAVDASTSDALAVALEWADLDPRLGHRGTANWSGAMAGDVVASAGAMLRRLAGALLRVPAECRIALSQPTIPLPPMFHTPGWLTSSHELQLRADLAGFVAELGRENRIGIVNPQRLAEGLPDGPQFDLRGDIYAGLPYGLKHAERLAALLAQALVPPAPKKGIISDLDDTLWSGIVGEVGPNAVTWDLSSRTQLHGLYQKLLSSLADSGSLLAIASKNDAAIAAEALARKDLQLPLDRVFPIEIHWGPKSASVARILDTWNIAADSVIFVDDSPMELAEVAAAHAGIECILFPKNDYAAGLAMLHRLRDLCGKQQVSGDDALRLDSIRRGATFRDQMSAGASPEDFLKDLDAAVTVDFAARGESRVLELVNKTNQFNLNGRRFTEAEWHKMVSAPGAVLAAVGYEDKFGPLGTIAVLAGHIDGGCLAVNAWVMSCRAFARRIEHQTLRTLFETCGVEKMRFDFAATPRNGPLREFFAALLGREPEGPFTLTRSRFAQACPRLYHMVQENVQSR